jgi:exodeoxyribonuclease III
MKILSWNINGLRSGIKEYLELLVIATDPDILCLQETKCTEKDADSHFKDSEIYSRYPYRYWNDAVKGRSGTCIFSRVKPLKVLDPSPFFQMNIDKGRIQILKFKDLGLGLGTFILMNTYVPNTGRSSAEITRSLWHDSLMSLLDSLKISETKTKIKLSKTKTNFIWCGDLNVVDNPALDSSSHTKRSKIVGGLKEFEYEEFREYLDLGLVDVFRYLSPREQLFTWFSSRQKNSKMRLDYFLVTKKTLKKVKDIINGPYAGSKVSDHTWSILII